jgi:hypothetical protein
MLAVVADATRHDDGDGGGEDLGVVAGDTFARFVLRLLQRGQERGWLYAEALCEDVVQTALELAVHGGDDAAIAMACDLAEIGVDADPVAVL